MAFRPYLARIWSSVRSRRSRRSRLGASGLAQQVQLDASLVLGDQIEGGHRQGTDGTVHVPAALRQGDGGLGQLPGPGRWGAPGPGAGGLISRKSGSRMARETPAAFIPARRRRTATRSDSMAMPEQISSRPDKLRGR